MLVTTVRSASVTLALVMLVAACTGGQAPADPTVPIDRGLDPTQPGAARPDPVQPDPHQPDPILTLPPGVQSGAEGPPGWVSVGTRITWYVAAASVAQGRFAMVPDPTCADAVQRGDDEAAKGCYFVKAEGVWYRKTDEGTAPRSQPTASGDGFLQIDVVGIGGGRAALTSTAYIVDRTFGQLSWTPIGGTTVNAQTVDGLWVHPAELSRAAEAGTFGGLIVATGLYDLGDRTVPSISFVSGLGTDSYQSYTYETQTGVLLSSNGSFGGSSQNWTLDGRPATAKGNMQLAMSRLIGVRQRAMPGTALPAWLASTSELRYVGNYNWTNPIDPSSGSLDYPIEQVVALDPAGNDWASYAARSVVPGLGLDTTYNGVDGPAGLFWYDPAALQGMTAGQVLDEDPVTNEKVTVSHAGPGAGGRNVVVIDSELPGVATRATYDLNGLLLAWEGRFGSTGTTILLQLASSR